LIVILSCGSGGELFVRDSIGLLASDGGGSREAITMEDMHLAEAETLHMGRFGVKTWLAQEGRFGVKLQNECNILNIKCNHILNIRYCS